MMSKDHTQSSYRWVIVFASALMLAISMGVMVNGISVFLIPLNTEFGWQRGAVSLINFFGLIGLSLGGILMGWAADRFSIRKIVLFGVVVLGLCFLAAAQAQALWQFYLVFFIAGFFGAGSIFTPLIANVGNWFKIGAGLAIGIASAGQALGQGGMPFGTSILISNFGWRDALTILGVISFVVMIPLGFLIRQPQKAHSAASKDNASNTLAAEEVSPTGLPTNLVIAWLSVAIIFCCTCMSVPLMHLVPLIQDKGIAPEQAGSVLFVMLIAGIFGRVSFGKLADVIGAMPAYMLASFWQTVMVFFYVKFEGLNAFYLYAVIYGFGYAGVMTGVLVCVRVLIPVSRRASALGITSMFGWLGHGIGGYQGGYFFDQTGEYTVTFAVAAIAGVINLIIVGSLYYTIKRNKPSQHEEAPLVGQAA